MTIEIFLLTFIPPLVLGFVAGQVMEEVSIKVMIINLVGFSVCALIAILAFVYIVVPQFNKAMFDKTQYIPLPEKQQMMDLQGDVELL